MSEDLSCRLCLSTEGSMEPIYNSPDADLSKKIFECTSVEIKNLAGLPSSICEICKSELIIWLKFRRQCIKTNEILKAKFPDLFAESQYEELRTDPTGRLEFVDMSGGEEASRQEGSEYRYKGDEADEDVPLLRFKKERSLDYGDESCDIQNPDDPDGNAPSRTIMMEIEAQVPENATAGKRRLQTKSNASDDAPKTKRKNSRGEVYVPLDHGEDKKPKWTVHPKGVDKLYNDPKPPDEKLKEANPRELGSSAAVVKTCNCSTKIEQMLNDLHRSNNEMFQHLTEEIVNLRREVLSMRSPNDQNLQTILPPTPFDNMDDFLKFENELQEDPDKFTELENTLSQQRKYNEPVKFVKEGIKIFFDDKLAEQFTWRGTSEKRNVRNLNCTMALRHAFRRRYPNSNEDIFDRTAMKHFQYAKDRTVKKMRYNKCDAEKFLKYQIAPKSLTDDSSPIENFKEMSN